MLGEPPRSPYDLNFSLFRIPVRVHPWFWLMSLILGYSGLTDAISVLTWVVAVFLSIMVHEFGHALVMRVYGFRPSITLYGMGGLTSYDQGFAGYRQTVGSLGEILICLAGPVAGFLLAAIVFLGVVAADRSGININYRVAALVSDILFISVVWGAINLLPIYPLDGGQIAREIFMRLSTRDGIRQSLVLSMVVAVGMAVYGLLQWHSYFVAIVFGYLAFTSYTTLQAYSGRRPW